MNQRQVIAAVAAVGLVSAAVWAWHASSQQSDGALGPAKSSAPLEDSFHNSGTAPAIAEGPAPSSQTSQTAPPSAVPEADHSPVSAQAQAVPPNVDTPEPAERKFARGARADDANQSPN